MKSPTAITKLGKLSLLVMSATLLLGSGSGTSSSAKLVAFSTLSPVQVAQAQEAPQKPAAVVQERIVRASAKAAPVAAQSGGASVGSVISGNNCVVCVRAMTGRSQNGNAGTWKASHSDPRVGDIMIWRPGQQGASGAGHVGVVVGVHGNKVSIKHCNWPGQTEFYSTGLFW